MTDKQIIINDQKKTIHRLQDECTEKTDAIVVLCETLNRKEQECEELKKIINEAKNSKLDLKSFLVGEAVQNEYEQQLDQLKRQHEADKGLITSTGKMNYQLLQEYDQLKAENEELKKKCNIYTCGICGNKEDCNKLYKTLTEIKEIAKRCGKRIPLFEMDEIAEDLKQILQKISEVEND